MASTTQTYEADLAVGVPTNPPVRSLKDEHRDWLRTGAPWPWFGTASPPRDWEAKQWLAAFRQLECEIQVSLSGCFAYHIPQRAEDEAFPLLAWIKAAERRAPGISYQIHALATQYNELKVALDRLKACSGQQAAA